MEIKMGNRPIIFLDVDGVLIRFIPFAKWEWFPESENQFFERFQDLVEKTNARIILSSSWRLHPTSYKLIEEKLATYNLQIDGKTENHTKILGTNRHRELGYDIGDEDIRTHEILAWLENNVPIITQWIAIDDMELRLSTKNFVRTHPKKGFTENIYNECLEKLSGSGSDE